MMIVARLAA